MPSTPNITQLLDDAAAGRDGAMDDLMAAVHDDMERMAERHMKQQFGTGLGGVTLEPAALVNETYLSLIRQRKRFDNRGHFFAMVTKIMLRVLMDYHRRRHRLKRGGDLVRVPLHGDHAASEHRAQDFDIPAFISALDRLESTKPRNADVVKMKLIWGLPVKEIAASLDVSTGTVERDWAFGRAWLAREMTREDTSSDA